MTIDIERERREQAALKKKSGGAYGWRPESGLEGGNVVRVLPFTHKVTKQDVAEGFFEKEQLGKTVTKWRGRSITSYYKGDKDKPSERFLLNIVDLTNKNGKRTVETWMSPKSVAVVIGDYVLDEDYGEGILGVEGRDFKIHFDKDADPAQMYKTVIRDEKLCKELDEELQEEVLDFYDPEIYAKFVQAVEGDDGGEETAPKRKRRETDDVDGDLE